MRPRIYVLERTGAAGPLVAPWRDGAPEGLEVVEAFEEDWEPPDDAALVVTSAHYQVRDLALLHGLLDAGRVGVLILADGILEYRNTWEHPELPPGAMFQPVLGHKIACIGRSQARALEAWGNVGRCEVVGLPRLDALLDRPRAPRREGTRRILVATAKNPGFTEAQRATALRALSDLREWHARHPRVAGVGVELVWRLTGGLDARLGIDARDRSAASEPIAELLERVDAVITTPSTVQLEAMLRGLPVAVLDYGASPLYVPSAWAVTAPPHLDMLLPELIDPPAPKRLFQGAVLRDALECHSPAAPRMRRLVEAMRAGVEACRRRGEPLRFAPRILADDRSGHQEEKSYELEELFPELREIDARDVARLRAQVAQLRHGARSAPDLRRELERWRRDAGHWQRRYARLAGVFPIRELLWLRRRLRRPGSARG
jgi:hypothetical protein